MIDGFGVLGVVVDVVGGCLLTFGLGTYVINLSAEYIPGIAVEEVEHWMAPVSILLGIIFLVYKIINIRLKNKSERLAHKREELEIKHLERMEEQRQKRSDRPERK